MGALEDLRFGPAEENLGACPKRGTRRSTLGVRKSSWPTTSAFPCGLWAERPGPWSLYMYHTSWLTSVFHTPHTRHRKTSWFIHLFIQQKAGSILIARITAVNNTDASLPFRPQEEREASHLNPQLNDRKLPSVAWSKATGCWAGK